MRPEVAAQVLTDMTADSAYALTVTIASRNDPFGSYEHADDVANAGLFLLSDASRWITGVNLPVDGGTAAVF